MTTIVRRKMPYYPLFRSFRTENDGDNRNNFAPLNIIENDNVYKVELNLAGWKKEDIEIKIEDETLIISGEMTAETNDENQYLLREFNNQKFFRSVILSDAIDQDNIEAELTDGMLRIELKKVPEDDMNLSKKIEIR